VQALTETKKCSGCGKILPATSAYFYRQSGRPSGFASQCKICKSATVKANRAATIVDCLKREKADRAKRREKISERDRAKRRNDKEWREKDLLSKKKWREANSALALELSTRWRKVNSDRSNELARNGYAKNRDKILSRRKSLRSSDQEWVSKERENLKAWRAANPEKARASYQRANIVGRARNPLRYIISSAVKNSLKRNGMGKNGSGVERILRYTVKELRSHIEKQFTGGMTWSNHGSVWELDHIVPLASFAFESTEDPEFVAAWAITNLRPLEKLKNRSKGGRREHLL
jgi:hypothetical protein